MVFRKTHVFIRNKLLDGCRKEQKMKRNLGKIPAVYPMPVLMVAAYDEKGTVNSGSRTFESF